MREETQDSSLPLFTEWQNEFKYREHLEHTPGDMGLDVSLLEIY